MDPSQLAMLQQFMQQQPQGMFGGQPQQPQQPPMGQPQHHGGGFNPLMFLSPLGGMMMSNPKMGLMGLSPAFGIANLLGAFK